MSKKWLLGILSTLIALLLVELVSRGFLYFRTPPGMVFDEHIIYTGQPHQTLFEVPMNDIGCIGEDWQPPKKPTEKRILLLGGSTSFSTTYPAQLQQTVSQRNPAFEVSVVSCGKPRYTSYINWINFERNLVHYSPDVVVLYMGINDCIYNSYPWISDLPDVGYFNWKSPSNWVSFDLLNYYIVEKQFRSQPEFSTGEVRSKAIFEQNLQQIIELAQSKKIKVILSCFAISYPSNDSSLVQTIQAQEPVMQHFWGNIPSTVYAVQQHNEIIRALANQYALPLVRVDTALPPTSTYFKDICHMTDAGKERMSEVIGEVIGEL